MLLCGHQRYLHVSARPGVTILSLHWLLTLHFFLGMLLRAPVGLKIFDRLPVRALLRGAWPYLRKAPPALVMRMLGRW